MYINSPLSEVSSAALNSRSANKSRRSSSAATKSPSKSARKSPSRRETADADDIANLLKEINEEDRVEVAPSVSKSSSKRRSVGNSRRETADAGDLAAMLQNLEQNENCDITTTTSARTSIAPSAIASPASAARARRTSNSRRQTADAADLAEMLQELENDDNDTSSTSDAAAMTATRSARSSAGRRNAITSSTKSGRKSGGGRRQTADASDLAAMLTEMESEADASACESGSAATSAAASPALTSTAASVEPAPATGGATSDDADGAGERRQTADTQQLADTLRLMQEVQQDDETEQSCLPLQDVISAPPQQAKVQEDEGSDGREADADASRISDDGRVLDISCHPNRFGVLYEDSTCSSRRTSIAPSEMDASGMVDSSQLSTAAVPTEDTRRQTADPAELENLLLDIQQQGDDVTGEVSVVAASSARCSFAADVPPATAAPAGAAAPSTKPLRSCLSTAKKERKLRYSAGGTATAVNRSVVFGSPDVAEFNKTSPVTSYTPLAKSVSKQMFPIPADGHSGANAVEREEEEDEETSENSRILEDWDRLTNASSHGSSEDDEEEDLEAAEFARYNDSTHTCGSGAEDGSTVELEDDLGAMLEEAPAAGSNKKRRSSSSGSSRRGSSSRRSSVSSRRSSLGSHAPVAADEDESVTVTVQLEENLADLMDQAEGPQAEQFSSSSPRRSPRRAGPSTRASPMNTSSDKDEDRTVELETDLRHLVETGRSPCKQSAAASPISSTGKPSEAAPTADGEEDHTVALEGSLRCLVDGAPSNRATSRTSSPKGRKSPSSACSSISRSNPKLARRRKSMLQPAALGADDLESQSSENVEEEQETTTEEEDGGCVLSALMSGPAGAVAATGDCNKSSATLLSELRDEDHSADSSEMSMGLRSTCNNSMTEDANTFGVGANVSTASGSSDHVMATDLSQYAGAKVSASATATAPQRISGSFEQVEVDEEVSFRRRTSTSTSRSSTGASASCTPSSVALDAEEMAATVPRSTSRRSSRRNSAASANGSAMSELTTSPAALDDISVISGAARSTESSMVAAPSAPSSAGPRSVRSGMSSVGDLQGDVVVSERFTLDGEEAGASVLGTSPAACTSSDNSAVQASTNANVNASGYFYAQAEDRDAACNSSVIGPLVSTFSGAANSRLSVGPGPSVPGVRSPLNQATQSTMEGATGKINGLLRKVQNLNSTARRNSLAHVQFDGSTAGRASTARFSVGGAARKSLKRPRYSLFTAGAAAAKRPSLPTAVMEAEASADSPLCEVAPEDASVNKTAVPAPEAGAVAPESAAKRQSVEPSVVVGEAMSLEEPQAEPEPAAAIVTAAPALVPVETNAVPTPVAVPSAAVPMSMPKPVVSPVISDPAPSEVVQVVVNNLSYCHVTRLTAAQISVTVVLSTYTHAYVTFHLAKQAVGTSKLTISNIEVELVNLFDDSDSSSSAAARDAVERENQLAYCYFAAIMCNGRFNGPLSEGFLSSHLTTASDIPDALHAITGYVVTFRQLLSSVEAYASAHGTEWKAAESGEGDASVVLQRGPQVVTISLPALLASQCDVRAAISSL